MYVIEKNDARKVLIVDDDEDVRDVVRLILETEDFEVVGEASNGIEAVLLAIQHQPGLVILDYRMPRLDGESTAEIFRSLIPGARIVAFSAILNSKPPWADAFLNKARIQEIAPLLANLIRA